MWAGAYRWIPTNLPGYYSKTMDHSLNGDGSIASLWLWRLSPQHILTPKILGMGQSQIQNCTMLLLNTATKFIWWFHDGFHTSLFSHTPLSSGLRVWNQLSFSISFSKSLASCQRLTPGTLPTAQWFRNAFGDVITSPQLEGSTEKTLSTWPHWGCLDTSWFMVS